MNCEWDEGEASMGKRDVSGLKSRQEGRERTCSLIPCFLKRRREMQGESSSRLRERGGRCSRKGRGTLRWRFSRRLMASLTSCSS